MDFRLSEEQEAVRRAAEAFAQGEFTPEGLDEVISKAEYPWEILKKAASLGFIGLHFPEKYGGQGYGLVEKVVVIESFCRQDPSLGMALSLSDVGSEPILYGGSDEQKERILPRVAKGDAVLSAGLSFSASSSFCDHSLKLAGGGDTAILSGKHSFVVNGGLAREMVIPEASDFGKGRGFIVETDQPGVALEESDPRMGLPLVPVRAVRFEDVSIRPINMLPQIEIKAFSALKVEFAAQSLGMARGAFERALEYAKKRKAFGRAIIEFQALNHMLADLVTRLESSKWLVYYAAWKLDQGDTDPRLASMAKLYGSMMATDLIREAIQIHGGYGFLRDYELERYYRDAWFPELFVGTAEDQKDAIAEIWLKKSG